VLRRLEAFVFFFAMMLVIILEGACVDWMCGHPRLYTTTEGAYTFVGEWTGLTLPQGWVIGASLVLIYRVTAMFIPPRRWGDKEFSQNRRDFLHLWRCAMALVAMQGLALFLGRAAAAS
jgi:hypothetical protein